MEQLLAEGSEIAVIGYHINDIYANAYSNARAEYYNMVGLPHVVIDGTQTFDVTYDAMLAEYNERIVIPSNYSISMDATRNGTIVNVSINVGQLGAPNPETKVLHLVLTESHIHETWYGGDEVHHVERLMIPDQNGTPIVSDKGVKEIFDFEFEMDPEWKLQNCELVAFLQDTVTKEVMQAQTYSLEQLVTYNDVAIKEIYSPGENYCNEEISPLIEIENYAIDALLSCEIEYTINGQSYNHIWNGELFNYESELVELPAVNVVLEEDNNIILEVSQPNGQPDESTDNNQLEKDFELAPLIPDPPLQLELKTDYFGSETSWELTNSGGEVLYSGSGYEDSTLYVFDWDLSYDDCYAFTIYDSGGDGICCENGYGYYRISNSNGMIYFLDGSFGSQESVAFQIDVETIVDDPEIDGITNVFPNPATDNLTIQSDSPILQWIISDVRGQEIISQSGLIQNLVYIDLENFSAGIYFVHVETAKGWIVRKLVIH